MVYKNHQFVREVLEKGDSSVWPDDIDPAIAGRIKNLRRSHPRIPYVLEVECNDHWGNFDREFIAYSMGILDDVQMRIKHSEEELEMFWTEVFNKEPLEFDEAYEEYELLRDYLFETFQDVDDWRQLTFYQIDWDALHKEKRNVLRIQLAKPLSEYWEGIIIPRMKAFFENRIDKWMRDDTELIDIRLRDSKDMVVKEY
jgi:hypothetical protein